MFSYLSYYTNFISSLQEQSLDSITRVETDTFIKSLCDIYIAHNIHLRINDEISKRTNISILKGDYYFGIGYDKIAGLGSKSLIKIYSRISEYFARVISNYLSLYSIGIIIAKVRRSMRGYISPT
jgi:hypothetical protein